MHVLDTDHMTILERGGMTAYPSQVRLRQVPFEELATTIIRCEEQVRGWLSHVAQAKILPMQVECYEFLHLHIETYRTAAIFGYDCYASEEFERMRQIGIRISTKDLRIAAICISLDAIPLTRNLRHFEQVPGLRFEDWSQ